MLTAFGVPTLIGSAVRRPWSVALPWIVPTLLIAGAFASWARVDGPRIRKPAPTSSSWNAVLAVPFAALGSGVVVIAHRWRASARRSVS